MRLSQFYLCISINQNLDILNIMKKLLSLIIAVITFYGCQNVILSEEYQENVPATRASVGSSDYYYLV